MPLSAGAVEMRERVFDLAASATIATKPVLTDVAAIGIEPENGKELVCASTVRTADIRILAYWTFL